MTVLSAILLFLAAAAPGFQRPEYITSHSGQFLVHGSGPVTPLAVITDTNQPVTIDIEPQFLAVAAERIKRAVMNELNLPDGFKDKIHLILMDRASSDTPIGLVTTMFTDGWRYEMLLPARIESAKLVRGLVQVILLELANRNANRGAEIPLWLLEGMSQEILSSPLPTYVLDRKVIDRELRGMDSLGAARMFLKTNSCLSFGELSFPQFNWKNREQTRQFQSSAQLLTHELLKFPNGHALMAQFIRSLPAALNWQTVFLQVYRSHFRRLLDVEKWWALVWIDFKAHEAHEVWPLDVSAQRLRSAVLTSIEVRAFTNSLPRREDVPLGFLLENAPFSTQKEVLHQKLQELFFMSFSLAPQTAAVAAAYRATIQEYLERRNSNEAQPGLKMDHESRNQVFSKEAARRFAALDAQLLQLESLHIPQPETTAMGTLAPMSPQKSRKRK